jgi:DNA-directed RNA polymerase subunit RPC12/RpoP
MERLEGNMAGVPIKFRCYRCQQLLGVARSKAGSVVSCPKCSAELVVPEPVESTQDLVAESFAEESLRAGLLDTAPNPSPAGAIDAGLPLDVLDIRPEDIRAEPGFRYIPPTPQPAEHWPQPETYEPQVDEPPPPPRQPLIPSVESPSVASPTVAVAPAPRPAPEDVVIPPIRIDARPVAPTTRNLPARPRDLILPRSIVTAWSLLVLLALGFAFFTGLLAGHFVWKIH